VDYNRNFSVTSKKKVAIVHDALVVQSGSEKVALYLSDLYPDAPIFTSAYLPYNTFPEFKNKKIITLPLTNTIKSERQFKGMFPWWYLGFSFLDLSQFDIVLSSANYLAKYINPPVKTIHICYLHNPFRFLWKPNVYSINSVPYNRATIKFINLFIPLLRKIDIQKTQRIRHILANSQNIARQIQDIYGLNAEVVYPPIKIDEYYLSEKTDDYYLYAGRLISHKRVDLAIEACNRLNRKLIVVGDGLERSILEKLAGDTIQFVGRVSDEQLKKLYSECRALIFPSDEDFGLVPVEVQASGRPVIAFRSGGALETVVEFETGVFFSEQNVDSVCDAILQFEKLTFDPYEIKENAKRFDIIQFNNQIQTYIGQFI
jgi:glycosyltransferase involved in cell wall biosynthesis